MAVTLRESYTPTAISQYNSQLGPVKYQTFTAVSSHNLDRIDLKLLKAYEAPSRTMGVYLYTFALGEPNVEVAQFGSFDVADLSYSTYAELSFSDTSYALTSGTDYAIVVYADDGVTLNTWRWATNTSNGYASGVSGHYYPALGWIAGAAGNDRWFKCYEDSSAVVYAEGTKTITAAATVDYITGPGKAWNPSPTDDQEDIAIIGRTRINTLTWNAPTDETPDYLVYFRAYGGTWALQETITDDSTSHTLSASVRNSLTYYSTYEWRVDTRDDVGTTTGDTWTFVSQQEGSWTDFDRPSDYDEDKVWEPGTGWVDIDSFEYTGGGRFKGRVLVIGHKVLYFGDI